jgi:high-affinity nickel permease
LAAKLGFAATLASGLFLYLIAIMYIIALIGMSRAFAKLRRGSCSDAELEAALNDRNFLPRLPRPIMSGIKRPVHYRVGVLFGFDTATDPVTTWISGIDLNNAGLAIVVLFAVTWIGAVAYWKPANVEGRYQQAD